MPRLDNLRLSQNYIDSEPFIIAGADGKLLFAGRVRLVFNASQAGVQIVEINAGPGVKLIDPGDGFLNFVSQVVEHNDEGPQRA